MSSYIDTLKSNSNWIAEVFLVVLATLVLSFIVKKFLQKLVAKTAETKTLWDDALFKSALKPANWIILLLGFSYAADITSNYAKSSLFELVDVVRRLGVIFIATTFITGFIARAQENLMSEEYSRKPLDKTTAVAMGKLLRIAVIITSVMVGLQTMGFSISGVLAFGGIGGIAVGFAAKDLLANFFGGLMIYLDRPFSVGDWVRSPDKQIEGTVEDIGWRLTRIRTFDKRPLYVPNSTFTQIAVENPSRMTNRRIKESIGIRYDDANKMNDIVNAIKQLLDNHEDIDHDQIVIVNFYALSPSSIDILVYCLTKTKDWATYHRVKQKILLQIMDIIDEHNAECAFPTSTVHIPQELTLAREGSD